MIDEVGYRWVKFASIVLFFAGVLRIFDSIWAFGYSGPLPQTLKHALFGDSITTYAWLWLITGVILIGAGISVLYLSTLGRLIGIVAAIVGGLGAMTWMPYYPVWSLLYIGLALLVIYALTVYGGLPGRQLAT